MKRAKLVKVLKWTQLYWKREGGKIPLVSSGPSGELAEELEV